MVRTRPPSIDAKPGTWHDVTQEAKRVSRRQGALLANALEKVFVEHAYVLAVYWNSDMAEELLEELVTVQEEALRSVFAEHLERWRGIEARVAEKEASDG